MKWLCWLSFSILLPFIMVSARSDRIFPEELGIETIFKPEDCSHVAEIGDRISIHYTGRLLNGKKIDSSLSRGTPIEVKLGDNQVIQGWEEGIPGMCVSEKRVLTIPSEKAYGSNGFGIVVPPDSPLVFDVELVQLLKERDEL